jgi:hypothetical protein
MPDETIKMLAIRLPEAERRRIKTVAASQGMTLQEALHQAMEAWVAKLQADGALDLALLPLEHDATTGQKSRRGRPPKPKT